MVQSAETNIKPAHPDLSARTPLFPSQIVDFSLAGIHKLLIYIDFHKESVLGKWGHIWFTAMLLVSYQMFLRGMDGAARTRSRNCSCCLCGAPPVGKFRAFVGVAVPPRSGRMASPFRWGCVVIRKRLKEYVTQVRFTLVKVQQNPMCSCPSSGVIASLWQWTMWFNRNMYLRISPLLATKCLRDCLAENCHRVCLSICRRWANYPRLFLARGALYCGSPSTRRRLTR